MPVFKRKGSPNWWVTWNNQAEMQAAQSVKMYKVVAWGIFGIFLLFGGLLSVRGTLLGFIYAAMGGGWIYMVGFAIISCIVGTFIGLIGWIIKRALTPEKPPAPQSKIPSAGNGPSSRHKAESFKPKPPWTLRKIRGA